MKRPNHYSAALKIFEQQQEKMIAHMAQAEAKAEARHQELLKLLAGIEALMKANRKEALIFVAEVGRAVIREINSLPEKIDGHQGVKRIRKLSGFGPEPQEPFLHSFPGEPMPDSTPFSESEASASQGEAEDDSPSSGEADQGEADESRKSREEVEKKLIRRLTRKKPSRRKR